MERLTGTRVLRVEDPRLLSGAGRFVDDERPAGVVHAAFVRSPVPHARIGAVRTEAAKEAPGVVAVLTADDLAGVAQPMQLAAAPEGFATPAYTCLASDKVRLVGDPVVLVLAESRALAEDAAELVEVDYEPLDGVGTIDLALDPGAPRLWDELESNVIWTDEWECGDVDAAFERADRVITERFDQHRQTNCPLETRGIVVGYDPSSGRLHYRGGVQGPHNIRMQLGGLLGLPANRIEVVNGDIGGSFGQKSYVRHEDLALSAAAMVLGTTVKWIEDRSENLLVAGQAREERATVEAAIDEDGVITGLRVDLVLDQGAYPLGTVPSSVFATIIRVLLPAAMQVEDYRFRTTIVCSNKGTYVAYRGPWEMETFVRERLLDRIARELELEPVEVRRRNLRPVTSFPSAMATGPALAGISLHRGLEEVVKAVDLEAFRRRQAEAREEGRLLGLGFSTFMEPAPGPANYGESIGFPVPPERAVARIESDGSLTVSTSQAPHGQSHETTLAQVAADRLGVPFESVRVVHGDSRSTPFSLMGTGGSRSATVGSGAVMGAVGEVREQVQRIAAHLLEASEADIEIADGVASVRGTPAAAVPLPQIAMVAWMAPHLLPEGMSPGLEATFDFSPGDGGWTQSVHACVVEVDRDTGLVDIERYVVVEDCGEVINPGIVAGQVAGGVAQGIAAVLYEHSAYTDDGVPLATSFMDYLLPTATEVPPIELHHLEPEAPTQEITFRGAGEGGAIGAPAALVNAIEDALSPFGVTIGEQHLPPHRILDLIDGAAGT